MTKPIIEIKNLGKRYRLGEIGASSLRDETNRLWNKLQGKAAKVSTEDFWALKDINLEINPGEVVGIIGKNGAGKSTLLKLISRITEPTIGEIKLRGRIAALLEVGTGFHPELTGRENIYLNGTILGMKKREIDIQLDEIIAFSGIEKHIDTPIKRYSSGMNVRLGFAVAAHLEPEILVVDEVLAVGDLDFQKKCIEKMDAVSKNGRTVLFVSHNMATISQLCPKSILLDKGTVKLTGRTEEIIQHYRSKQDFNFGQVFSNTHFDSLKIIDDQGTPCKTISADSSVFICATPSKSLINSKIQSITFGINNSAGERLFTVGTDINPSNILPLKEQEEVNCDISNLSLPPGEYFIKPIVSTVQQGWIVEDELPAFEIVSSDFFNSGKMTTPALGKFLKQAEWSKTSQT